MLDTQQASRRYFFLKQPDLVSYKTMERKGDLV